MVSHLSQASSSDPDHGNSLGLTPVQGYALVPSTLYPAQSWICLPFSPQSRQGRRILTYWDEAALEHSSPNTHPVPLALCPLMQQQEWPLLQPVQLLLLLWPPSYCFPGKVLLVT